MDVKNFGSKPIDKFLNNGNPIEKKTLFMLPSAPKSLVSILFAILYSLEV